MHDKVISSEVIDPSGLGEDEKARFVEQLYKLHQQIFDGVDEADFTAYVVDSPAQWTRIRLYKNTSGEMVGYCAVHRFQKQISNCQCIIFRAEAGILREYRGRSLTLWFALSETAKYRLFHPFRTVYYLGSFVHPAVFYMLSKYLARLYPEIDQPLPPRIQSLMLELADAFHLEPVPGEGSLVRQVGWITRESDRDVSFWQQHEHPAVKFYIQSNPGYAKGNGLLTLVPLSFGNILLSLFRFVVSKLMKRLKRFM